MKKNSQRQSFSSCIRQRIHGKIVYAFTKYCLNSCEFYESNLPAWKISPLFVDLVWGSKQKNFHFSRLLNSWFTASYIKHATTYCLAVVQHTGKHNSKRISWSSIKPNLFEMILYCVPGNWVSIRYNCLFYYQEA